MTFKLFRLLPAVEKMGEIRSDGDVFSADGVKLGNVSSIGEIKSATGKILGRVNRNGQLLSDYFDVSDYKVGRNGYIYQGGSAIGTVQQAELGVSEKWAQWANCCFFLIEQDNPFEEIVADILEEDQPQPAEALKQGDIETIRNLAKPKTVNLRDEKLYNSLELDEVNFYLERRKLAFKELKKREKNRLN